MPRPIAVVEPQMEEVFHAPFNAALLHAVVLAYPGASVSFRAFPVHTQVVRSILDQHAPGLAERIEWRPLPVASSSSTLARWRQGSAMLRQVLTPGEDVLFCSISRMQLLQLKRALRSRRTSPLVRAVLHGDLHRIEFPLEESFPKSLFSLPRVLRQPHPPALRYLVLSESIRANIPPAFRQAMGEIGVIDHPYHFFPPGPAVSGPPILGIMGNSGDGRLLETVVRPVKEANPAVRFRLVGFMGDEQSAARMRPWVEDLGWQPITREAFNERAQALTHVLWLSPPEHFRLRASGTFLDALAFVKPLVYLSNPYIDPYHAQEPGIGLRCQSVQEMIATILDIAADPGMRGYDQSRAAILRLRERFSPEALAKILPEALRLN